MALRLLFAGGGTGGHVTPLLAIAQAVQERYANAEIRFAGTERGVESRMVPQAGFPLEIFPVIGLKRELHPDLIRFPWMLLKGIIGAFQLISRFRPHTIVCTGGYVSGPIGFAACLSGTPLVLHEQNSFPGLTVKLLASNASQIYLAFREAAERLGRPGMVVGNPIRNDIARVEQSKARMQFGLAPNLKTLFVTGASQGALGINQAVADALPALMAGNLQILWQTGKFSYQSALESAEKWKDRVIVETFINDMGAAYSSADLAVTRAGGMTLSELSSCGVPAILIPLPTSAENHQEYNARARVQAGMATMIKQSELSGKNLSKIVMSLLSDQDALEKMAGNSLNLATPNAASEIVAGLERAGLLKS